MENNKIKHSNGGLGRKSCKKRRLWAENRKKWLKMPYQAYFGPPVLREKIFLSLAAEWDLLGIWSGRKYVRTKEIVQGTQTMLKKIRISPILALSS